MENELARNIDASVVSFDNYFKDPNTFPIVLGHPDYDRIEAIDWEKSVEDFKATKGNVIAEGFLILASVTIREMLDISFFIDTAEDTLIARRLVREPDTDQGYISKVVRVRHRNLVLPTKQHANKILDGSLTVIELTAEAEKYIRSHHSAD